MSGLRLFLGGDLDDLVDRYVEGLATTQDPLRRETVVVPNSALGQWFEQAVARRTGPAGRSDGVVANVDIIFPSTLIGRVLYGDSRGAERWSAMALALALLDEEGPDLSASDALARGAALERLLVHRPGELDELLGGAGAERERRLIERRRRDGDLWPAALFDRDGVAHAERAGRGLAIVDCLSANVGGLLCAVARSLADRVPIDVFLVLASRDLDGSGEADPADRSLAQRWGAVAGAHLDLWRSRAAPDAEVWVEGRPRTPVLAALCDAAPGPGAAGGTLEVHRAAGVARQVEVARDAILRAIGDLGVAPHRVRVVTPEAHRVAPLLALYFESDDPGEPDVPRVQFEVADPHVARASARLDGFRELLRVVDADLTVHDVALLLGQPSVRDGLGLSRRDVGRLLDLAREGRVSLGLDASSRASLDVFDADDDTGTWTRLVDRVVCAHLFDPERDEAAQDIVTLGVSDDLEAISRFSGLLSWLAVARRESAHPLDLAGWAGVLARWSALRARDERVRDPGLDRLLAELSALAGWSRSTMPFASVREVVEALSSRSGGSTLVGRGGATVLDLTGPSRVPFEVTCVIGLDDEALPESTRRVSEMGEPRPTDPDPRAEFRSALLDLIASTRRRVIVVTNDRSVVDGSALATSQPLAELVAVLGPHGLVSERRHPRHGFSALAPVGGDGHADTAATLDPVHGEVARALAERDPSRPDADVALVRLRTEPRPPAVSVEAASLSEFLRAPQRVFLRDALGAAALHAGRAEEIPDVPHLDLGGALGEWSLRERLLAGAVAGGADPVVPTGPDSPVAAVATGFRPRVIAGLDVAEIAHFARHVRDSLAEVHAERDPRGERPAVVRGRHHEIARGPLELYRTDAGPVLMRYTTSRRYSSRLVALLVDLAVLTAEVGEAVTGVLLRGRTETERTRAPRARPFLSASWASPDPVGDAQRLLGGLLRLYARRFDGLPMHFSATSIAYGSTVLDLGLADVFADPAKEWLTRGFGEGEDHGESLEPENRLLVPLEYAELMEVFDGAVATASVELARLLGAISVHQHAGTTPWTGVVASMREGP